MFIEKHYVCDAPRRGAMFLSPSERGTMALRWGADTIDRTFYKIELLTEVPGECPNSRPDSQAKTGILLNLHFREVFFCEILKKSLETPVTFLAFRFGVKV